MAIKPSISLYFTIAKIYISLPQVKRYGIPALKGQEKEETNFR